jgi:hypothetical protein
MSDDWYSIVQGRELQQGDILLDCPIYSLPLVYPPRDGVRVTAEVGEMDQIILSQSCDLVEGQEKLEQVVMCAVPTLLEAQATSGHSLAKRDNRLQLIKHRLVSFHPLKEVKFEKIERPMSVVTFSMVATLPVAYVREFAAAQKHRLRLKSPFREHLAQRFAIFFGRIGLPEELTLPDPEA